MLPLEQIIKGCQKYDRSAQKQLYEKFASLMKAVCYKYLDNIDDTNDVLQEGFIKVFMNIKQFSGKGSFEGWMKRIFINTAIIHLNKLNKTRKVNSEISESSENFEHASFDEMGNNVDKGEQSLANNYSTIDMANLSEMEMMEIIRTVPEKYRTVFNLFCLEDYSHDEIAEMLKIDTATSRTRLLRARNIIKEKLYKYSLEKMTS